jgi:hypothetical protein
MSPTNLTSFIDQRQTSMPLDSFPISQFHHTLIIHKLNLWLWIAMIINVIKVALGLDMLYAMHC